MLWLKCMSYVRICSIRLDSAAARWRYMRHSDSLASADLFQRAGGMTLLGAVAEEGGVRVGEFPSEHSEVLGLSKELILAPFLVCRLAS